MTLDVRVVGSANLTQMRAEFGKLEAQVAALNAQIAAMTGPHGAVNPRGWQAAQRTIHEQSSAWRAAANSTGMFEAAQIRVKDRTTQYIDALEKQKLTFKDVFRSQRREYQAAYREQLRMQQMVVKPMPGLDQRGRRVADFAVPTEVHKSWDTLGKRIGWAALNLQSASLQLQNWGKNTQWAGRQMMVGLTMPIAALGAATGVLAYQVDKQLTRIQKVYDTTAGSIQTNVDESTMREMEFLKLREDAWETATEATIQYGVAAKDTLEVQAELAAQGKTGAELQAATNQVMRIATLGEFEHAEALKTVTALQSIMGYNAEEVGRQLNYMNAIENATSLATQDFAKAIPIALGPLKEMGGDVQDLALLLVAMKERGIEASEGANAIKSMMQRLYRPSKQIRQEWQALAGVNLTAMVKNAGGDIMVMLGQIQRAVEGLSRPERVQLLGGLFGTYQVARQNAILKGLEAAREGIGQTSQVLKVNEKGWESWADTADREIEQIRQSASGRFRIALENLKNQLTEMGEPFLNMATGILTAVSKLIGYLEDLPGPIKTVAKYAAIFVAIVGPVTMLVGLFANFLGTMGRFAFATLHAANGFELLNKETAVSAAMNKLAEKGFIQTGSAVAMLTQEVKKLVEAQMLANEIAGVMPAKYFPGAAQASDRIRRRTDSGTFAPGYRENRIVAPRNLAIPEIDPQKHGQAAFAASAVNANQMADGVERAGIGMKALAVSGGIFSVAMAASLVSSNQIVDKFAQIAMFTSLIVPGIAQIGILLKAVPWATMTASLKGGAAGVLGKMANTTKVIGANIAWWAMGGQKFTTMLKAGGLALAGMLGPIGLIITGLTAAGAAAYLIHKNMSKGRDEIKKTYQDADALSKILGYTPTEGASMAIENQGKGIESSITKAQKFRQEYTAITQEIKRAADAGKDFQAFQAAMSQGLKVISTGGTAEQAVEAVKIALEAAVGFAEAQEIILKFKPLMDFTDVQNQINQFINQASRNIDQAMNDVDVPGYWENVFSLGSSGNVGEARARAAQAGQDLAKAFQIALENGLSTQKVEDTAERQLQAYNKAVDEAVGTDLFPVLIRQRDEFLQEFTKGFVLDPAKFVDELDLWKDETISIFDIMRRAGNMPISTENWEKLVDSWEALDGGRLAAYTGETEDAADAMGDVAGETGKAGKGTDKLARSMQRAEAQAQSLKSAWQSIDWSSAARDVMSNVQSQLSDIASANFQNRMDSALDAYRAQQQARTDALTDAQERQSDAMQNAHERQTQSLENHQERRRKAVERSYDKRIARVQKLIDAEKKAENVRKSIFDAEMARIQRMNETENRTIDFNVALDEGNLDEAAKIRNDMVAQEEQWSLEDSEKRAEARSEKRIATLEKEMDKIEQIKDRRLAALAEVEERENRYLQRRQEAQEKALRRQQERQQKALQREVDANIAAQEEIWQTRKEKLDMAIAMFQAFVPRNEKELRNHISRISKQYGDFNVATRGKFDRTSVAIGQMLAQQARQAALSLRSDIAWEAIGAESAQRLLWGALGMDRNGFMKWMKSGIFPENSGNPPTQSEISKRAQELSKRVGVDVIYGKGIKHEGGWVGKGKSSRKGVARTAPMMPNESLILAENDEFVVNAQAARKHHEDLEAMNAGGYTKKPNKVMGGSGTVYPGMAGMLSGLLRASMSQMLAVGIATGALREMQRARDEADAQSQFGFGPPGPMGTAPPGRYGDVSFSAEQLRNAGIIASVGRGMGMSSRDLVIGLMTAMQESTLRNVNYGDRDSLGLFQQRPSQGWGTPSQVTDPVYASRKFFSVLKTVENRDSMPLTLAAQAVQRSAYPYAYAKWENEARAILSAMAKKTPTGASAGGPLVQGPGGRFRPVAGGSLSRGGAIHDTSSGFPAVDFAIPVGTPVRAVASGRIASSYDIRGYEPRAPHGGLGYRSYGRVITIDHGGFGSLYAHLSQRRAQKGQTVRGGTVIGLSGNTGYSTGPHLHFGTRGVNPYTFVNLQKGTQEVKWDNTVANLHKGESVLTKDLTTQFKQGVENFANGGNSEYNLYMNITEPGASAEEIADKVITKIKWQENRKPKGVS